jgi:hypothetical protein
MRQIAMIIVAAAVLAVPQAAAKEPVAPKTVFGIVWQDRQTSLVELDALTLRPVSKAAKVGIAGQYLGRSVGNGMRAAFIVGDRASAIRFVNLTTMKPERRVALPCYIAPPVLWETADRLVVTCSGSISGIVVVDPVKQRVVSYKPLKGDLLGVRARPSVLAGVLAPFGTIGEARLLVVDGAGKARTVALPGIRAGTSMLDQETYRVRIERPAVALDPRCCRVAIVPATGPITVVDLATLAVSSHAVRTLSALRKNVEGAERSAVWTWTNTIAVSGRDWLADGQPDHAKPAGLTLVDIDTWTSRTLDPDTAGVFYTGLGGVILSSATIWDSTAQKSVGNGLTGYGLDGSLRFHALQGQAVLVGAIAGTYAYIADNTFTHFQIVNTMTGKIIGTASTARTTTLAATRPTY